MKASNIEKMEQAADRASTMLKTLGHPGRLMILCNLADGERAVGDLADEVGMSQSTLSQHLARMRREGLVTTRRESQTIFYSLADGDVRKLIKSIYGIFCPK